MTERVAPLPFLKGVEYGHLGLIRAWRKFNVFHGRCHLLNWQKITRRPCVKTSVK